MNVGKNIKQLRELKNFSQLYMAEQLGISQRNYSNIESNGNNISVDYIDRIAKILNISVAKILELNAETIFNNHSQEVTTLNNQVINNGLADKERALYEKLIHEKDLRIKTLEGLATKKE
ncbi:MAG: helix-turn-helix transcriptional regulator [Bacteroidetes bacterium]|nr:helix-turn-helix transcriptional regulator [Bacteroidota bacterium]